MSSHNFDTSTAYNYDGHISMSVVSPCNTVDINQFGKNFLPPFYSVIFIVSVLGNGLVLYVTCKFEKLNSVTNIFLINLVASNLIFTINLPFRAVYHRGEWIFYELPCKILGCTYYVGFYSSVFFLMLMTFDRYLAVVHPVAATRQRKSCYAYILAAIVWFVSILASLETFFSYNVDDDPFVGKICDDSSDPANKVLGVYFQFAVFFLFPLVVIIYCYFMIGLTVLSMRMKGKHRTVRLIFVIVVLFFLCWSPYNIIILMQEQRNEDPCDGSLIYAQYVTHNIAHLYFCINPVFYTFVGRKFQNHVRRLMVYKMPFLKNQISIGVSSRSVS